LFDAFGTHLFVFSLVEELPVSGETAGGQTGLERGRGRISLEEANQLGLAGGEGFPAFLSSYIPQMN